MTCKSSMLGRQAPSRFGPDGGFALIAAIWMATLLAVVASVFTSSVRSYISDHSAARATAEAEMLAEAGVNLAVLDLVQSGPHGTVRRFPIDGSAVACQLPGSGILAIRVRDEAGKVDLNAATDPLLKALLTGAGLTPTAVSTKIEAIADYKDGDTSRRLNGAEADEYLAAGRLIGPKNAPFDAIEELSDVFGFNSELYNQLRPHVTLYSGQDGVDPAVASRELLTLLTRGAGDSAFDTPSLLESTFASSALILPPQFTTVSTKRAFSIEVEARTERGAHFVREAIVSLIDRTQRQPILAEGGFSARPQSSYRIWRWRRGDGSTDISPPQLASNLSPC